MLGSAVQIRLAAPFRPVSFKIHYMSRAIQWDKSKGRPEPIAALNKIPEFESGEPLVSMQEAAPTVRYFRPQAIMYCRKSVAEMIELAARSLPKGYYLGLIEAWRPIERQERIYSFWHDSAAEAFPQYSKAQLRRVACRWAAPTDQKAPPGHCTGAAVDVSLLDENNEPYDVTSPYVRFQGARTYTLGLTEQAHRNRMILVEAMLTQGFSNCRDEYWHYSYGDAGWAVRLDKPSCIYGLVRLEPELYAENERQWLEMFKDRTNPFMEQPKPTGS